MDIQDETLHLCPYQGFQFVPVVTKQSQFESLYLLHDNMTKKLFHTTECTRIMWHSGFINTFFNLKKKIIWGPDKLNQVSTSTEIRDRTSSNYYIYDSTFPFTDCKCLIFYWIHKHSQEYHYYTYSTWTWLMALLWTHCPHCNADPV